MKRFHSLGAIPVYGEDTPVFDHGAAKTPVPAPTARCCVPAPKSERKSDAASCCAK
jgi:hypothetical protein